MNYLIYYLAWAGNNSEIHGNMLLSKWPRIKDEEGVSEIYKEIKDRFESDGVKLAPNSKVIIANIMTLAE